jgi:hypothetical protein
MDAAEQRIDDLLQDLWAEPRAYDRADGDIAIGGSGGGDQIPAAAQQAERRDQARAYEVSQPTGHARDRVGGQRQQPAACPREGAVMCGSDELVAE